MGTWGAGIKQNDTVSDIIGGIDDLLKAGDSIEAATKKMEIQFSELKGDIEEEPLLWIALAYQQWKYGQVETRILNNVRNDIASGKSFAGWDEDAKLLAKRKEVLQQFLTKIEATNPKPSPRPKIIIRKAFYSKGDCLSVLLPDGRYTAAIVLAEDNSNPEYGKNLVGSLDYLETYPPTVEIFKQKKWLVLTFGNWKNEKVIRWYPAIARKKEKAHLNIIGNIKLGWLDPKESKSFTAWANLGKSIIYQKENRLKLDS